MNTCPVSICDLTIKLTHVMCLTHWRMVPKPLQVEVWDTWHARQFIGSPDSIKHHESAKQRAVDTVDKKLAVAP